MHFQRLQPRHWYAQEASGSNLAATQYAVAVNAATGDLYSRDQLQQRAEELRAAAAKLDPIIDRLTVTTTRYYKWRNRLLFSGFAVLVVARILPAYIA